MREVTKAGKKIAVFTAKDAPALGKVLTLAVQMIGEATHVEVVEFLERIGGKANTKTVLRTLEALRAKNILAEGHRGRERIYRMKKLCYNIGSGFELAYVVPLLNRLDEDPMANVVARAIDGDTKSQPKTPYPSGLQIVRCTLRLTCAKGFLGGHPFDSSDSARELYDASPTAMQRPDPKEPFLVFERRSDGAVQINAACIRGWFVRHASTWGLKMHELDLFRFEPLVYTGKLTLEKIPIQRKKTFGEAPQKDGAGFSHYEQIPCGTELSFNFAMPLQHFMTPDQMRAGLARALSAPGRSMSPARGTQYGAAELIGLEVIEKIEPWARPKASNGQSADEATNVETPAEIGDGAEDGLEADASSN